jgi:two-component system, response regulator PdtaR
VKMSVASRTPLAGRRILLVEDERLIALDMEGILRGWGCRIAGSVATAQAALEVITADPPDAAVLDVNLRVGTSETVAAALRASQRPFVVLTAYRASHLTGALRDAPVLRKPVEEEKLAEVLTKLLDESEGA